MKAFTYKGIKDLVLEEVETPPCPPDGILLQVKACGSNLRIYYFITVPSVPLS